MRYLLFSIILLVNSAAGAADVFPQDPTLPEMVLSYDQYIELNYPQKVAYRKFVIFLAMTIEDLQISLGEDHSKAQNAFWQNLQLIDAAYAASGDALIGTICLSCMNVSQYVKDAGGHIVCKSTAVTTGCDAGQVSCGMGFSMLAAEAPTGTAKPLCINSSFDAKNKESWTHRAVNAWETKHNLDPNSADLEASFATMKPKGKVLSDAELAQYRQNLQKTFDSVRSGLTKFAENRLNGKGKSISEYCNAKKNQDSIADLQKDACDSLLSLLKVFKAVTAQDLNPFAANTLKPDVASIPTTVAKTAPVAPLAPEPVDPEATKSAPATGPGAQAVNTTPAGTTTPAAKDPKVKNVIPAPGAVGDCASRYKSLGAIACVACGLEVSDSNVSQGQGVSHWLSLLGSMAQQYYGPYNVSTQHGKEKFQEQVIDMVSSYGYCTNAEYPTGNDNGLAFDAIKTQGTLDNQQKAQKFASTYGLTADPGSGDPLLYAGQIFDDSDPGSGFSTGGPQPRTWRFRSMIKAYVAENPKTHFAQCARALDKRLTHNDEFRLCRPHMVRGSDGHLHTQYPDTVSSMELNNHTQFYNTLATSCGLSKKPKEVDLACDHTCWQDHSIFANSDVHMLNCFRTLEPVTTTSHGGGGCGSNCGGHPQPPSGGGESQGTRSGTYGSTHGNPGGNPGGTGGGTNHGEAQGHR